MLECNYSKIKNYQQVCQRPTGKKNTAGEDLFELNPTTHVISIMMMVIGMNEISAKNWREVWWRLRRWEAVSGPLRTKHSLSKPKGIYLEEADIAKHVGMTTNVGKPMSRAAFVRKLADVALDHALRKAGLDKR